VQTIAATHVPDDALAAWLESEGHVFWGYSDLRLHRRLIDRIIRLDARKEDMIIVAPDGTPTHLLGCPLEEQADGSAIWRLSGQKDFLLERARVDLRRRLQEWRLLGEYSRLSGYIEQAAQTSIKHRRQILAAIQAASGVEDLIDRLADLDAAL
jgi:hypothetical protein